VIEKSKRSHGNIEDASLEVRNKAIFDSLGLKNAAFQIPMEESRTDAKQLRLTSSHRGSHK
jgi:hypothetical protein